MVADSRLAQLIALLDDARCLVADLLEDDFPDTTQLGFVRGHINDAIVITQGLQGRSQCGRQSMPGGNPCRLLAGHNGLHRNNRGYEWSDTQDVSKYSSGFD